MLFLWVHYLGSGREGSSIWNCHNGFHSMGQGASVRFCELVIFTIIHSGPGKVTRAWLLGPLGPAVRQTWTTIPFITWSPLAHPLTRGPLCQFEFPVVSLSSGTEFNSPWKFWIVPFPILFSGLWSFWGKTGEDSQHRFMATFQVLAQRDLPPLPPPSQGILGLWAQTLGKFWFSTTIFPTRARVSCLSMSSSTLRVCTSTAD